MGVKIGEETLLSVNTVLKSGEQVSVSRSSAGDAKAPLAMAVTSASGSPAYDQAWLNDPKGIVNVAMAQAMIDASTTGGGAFDSVFDVSIGTQNRVGAKETDKIIELASYSGWIISSLGDIDVEAVQGLNMKGRSVSIESSVNLTLKDISGSYVLSDLTRTSAFDGSFNVTDSAGYPAVEANNSGKKAGLISQGGWDILANGQIYINSYGDNLQLGGHNVYIEADPYLNGVLRLRDSTGDYALADLAGGGGLKVYRTIIFKSGPSTWLDLVIPSGVYKVDVLIFSKTLQSINYNIFKYMGSGFSSVMCLACGGTDNVTSVMTDVSQGFYPGVNGGTVSCKIVQMSFIYEHSGGKATWPGTDILKFEYGHVTYTEVASAPYLN